MSSLLKSLFLVNLRTSLEPLKAESGVPSFLLCLLVSSHMATVATSPSSPLRPEDLLSDSSEPPGLNQVSSEVTSQLYTSLHLSRQAEATARAQLYLASTSPPNEGLDSLAQELSRSLSIGLENNVNKKVRGALCLGAFSGIRKYHTLGLSG